MWLRDFWRVKPAGVYQSGLCLRRGSFASSSVFLKTPQGRLQLVLSVGQDIRAAKAVCRESAP